MSSMQELITNALWAVIDNIYASKEILECLCNKYLNTEHQSTIPTDEGAIIFLLGVD